MPRLLKRLTLAFAVLAIGFMLAAVIGLRVFATRLMADDTEPVRKQLIADWEKNADALDTQLAAVATWGAPNERTPPELGCQLRWTGESPAVHRHLARCPDAPPPIDEQTLAALDSFKEALLVKHAEAPQLERDFAWMSALQGHDDWSQVTGTPLEFFDVHEAIVDAPVLALQQVRGIALLRLLHGQRKGDLDGAVKDVEALAHALLNRPFVLDQLVGVAILDRTRALLDSAGRTTLGPSAAEVQALRGARLASAMLWHPWVPKVQRDRFLGKIPTASRCAAATEALLVLELGPLLQENYAQFAQDFAAWRKTNPCPSDFVNQSLDARATMPEGSWKRLLSSADFIRGAEQGDFASSLLVKAIESTSLGRRAVTELILSVTTAKPFPPAKEAQQP